MSRVYPASALDPGFVGSFASASVVASLGPADWQVCQDADAALVALALAWDHARTDDVEATITVHVDHIEVRLSAGEVTVSERVDPRVPFSTVVTCELGSGLVA